MDKWQFTFNYNATVMANSKDEAIIKAIEVLTSISEPALKLWLASHYKAEQIIESGGNLADIN